MLQNYYHLPFVISVRNFARKYLFLSQLKKIRFSKAEYEDKFHKALLKGIKDGDVVWDIGVNIGFYTKIFSSSVGVIGEVNAFEPMPSTFETLKTNCDNLSNVFLHNVGFSDKKETVTFKYNLENDVTATRSSEYDFESKKVNVKLLPVDLFLKNHASKAIPQLVKIDVEGFEEDVLLGASKTFSHLDCRNLFIEIHFTRIEERNLGNSASRIVNMLNDWGFNVKWIDSSHIHAYRK
jgi:FkbM family methyltransferase